MRVPDPDSIRNICFCGHAGSGKTTLCERLLFASGAIRRMGSVEEGNTTSDYTAEEQRHHHSLQPSIMHFDHEGHHVNIIDTPGIADFIGHAIACFPAAETVALVIDAVKGIESTTRRLMQVATKRNLPRMIVINKIDAPEANLAEVTNQIRSVFGDVCLPINLPTPDLSDVIDVFETDAHDATAIGSAEEAHTQIVEQVVEVDDQLTESYLDAGPDQLDHDQLHNAFEKALREGHLVPIVYVSARSGAGVAQLLHVAASLLPNPLEGNPRPLAHGDETFVPDPDPAKPPLAHIFRVATDPHVGKLGIFRVHQGTVASKSELFIDDGRKPVRIGHVMRLQGKTHTDAEALGPGEIGAVAKVEEVCFNCLLHTESGAASPPRLIPPPLPKPMYGLAVQLKSHADETKFSAAVHKLEAEDPCFVVDRVAATKQTVMRGLGELHLRVIIEKLKSQFGIEVDTMPPKIAYKETIVGSADGHCRHKKQTGGAGQFGEVYLRVAPLPPDAANGFEFVNKTVGGSIPKQFMPAIEKGVRQVLRDGAVAGYPMSGVHVEVYDGKHHDVDSKEIAFITAGRKAFVDAVRKANPVLLEPFVEVEVTAPSEYMGDITSGLSVKRGRVNDTRIIGSGTCVITATAPMSELQNYATELNSITAGTGTFTMDYSHDEPAPANVQHEVIAAFRPHEEED